jgi:hypothetical protein
MMIRSVLFSMLAWLIPPAFVFAETTLNNAIQTQQQTQQYHLQSQLRINQLDSTIQSTASDYRQRLDEIRTLTVYNDQLEKLTQSQQQQLSLKEDQLKTIDQTEQSLIPLMLRMIDMLARFNQLDIPFLATERHARISALRSLMNKASVSNAEKYRRIIDVYLTEIEYGHTIEAYQATPSDHQDTLVDFLRIGRIALYYRSLDKKHYFFWSNIEHRFLPLPAGFEQSIETGFRLARKQTAPEFLKLYIAVPTKDTL